MKKLNKLTHTLTYLILVGLTLVSCGTEEDPHDNLLVVTVGSSTVQVGSAISFMASTTLDGDVTTQATYFVNGEQIEGNTFTPTVANESNEVYATFDGLTSSTAFFSSTDVLPSAYTQKVLVEDYTGTWCGYCPRMFTILEHMTDYSERVIPIAIHCPGSPTDPWAYEYALEMTNPANYNATGQPKGKINRIFDVNQFTQQYPCPSSNPEIYTPQLDQYLNMTAPLGLAINSTLNGNSLTISVKVGFATDAVPDARLVVTLLEDGLSYNQANYLAGTSFPDCVYNSGSYNVNPIPNFPQEHVLLKAYTDIYGDIIPQSEISNGAVYTKDFNVSLPSNVTNSQNLSIVAFVLGNGDQISNREVINVQKAHVGVNQNFD